MISGLTDLGEAQSQTTVNSCKTRTCSFHVCQSLTDIQEAEASGSGTETGEAMQKNDQGDEFLKVSETRSRSTDIDGQLSENRRVTVRSYNKKTLVDLREVSPA